MDINNHNLGMYVSIAFNSPQKYPKKPFLQQQSEKKKVTDWEEMEKIARRNTIILGGKINGS